MSPIPSSVEDVAVGGFGAALALWIVRVVTPAALRAIQTRDAALDEYRQQILEEAEDLKIEVRRLNHEIRRCEVSLSAYKAHYGPLPQHDTDELSPSE